RGPAGPCGTGSRANPWQPGATHPGNPGSVAVSGRGGGRRRGGRGRGGRGRGVAAALLGLPLLVPGVEHGDHLIGDVGRRVVVDDVLGDGGHHVVGVLAGDLAIRADLDDEGD